jgi:hypothetical protein
MVTESSAAHQFRCYNSRWVAQPQLAHYKAPNRTVPHTGVVKLINDVRCRQGCLWLLLAGARDAALVPEGPQADVPAIAELFHLLKCSRFSQRAESTQVCWMQGSL